MDGFIIYNNGKITSNKPAELSFDEGLVFLYGSKIIKSFVLKMVVRRSRRNYSTVHTNFINCSLPIMQLPTPQEVDEKVASVSYVSLSMEDGKEYKWVYPV